MSEIKRCPFCGGEGKPSFRQIEFIGQNYEGNKKIVYRVQVICNSCKARGKPIRTDPIIDPMPWFSKWGDRYHPESHLSGWCKVQTEMFEPYVEQAIDAWNTRFNDK